MKAFPNRFLSLFLAVLLLSVSGCTLLPFRDIRGDTETAPPDSAPPEISPFPIE